MFLNFDNSILIFLLISLIIIFIVLLFLHKKSQHHFNLLIKYEIKVKEINDFYDKYKDITNIDEALKIKQTQLLEKEKSIYDLQNEYLGKETMLNNEYFEKKKVFDSLLHELQILEEDLEFKSFGLYNPHYHFDTSEKYLIELELIRDKQKEMLKNHSAAVCHIEWIVNGTKREGQQNTRKHQKLMVRAFNNECDSAVLKVRWNNVTRMEERIKKAYEAINKLGTVDKIEITAMYMNLKLDELRLAYEYEEKKQQEKEEARRRREEAKEEEKVQEEIEEVIKQADKEEIIYQDALERARKEISTAKENEISELNYKIEELKKRLDEVNERRERAISRAQLTKSGYVYIISNIGSFGENIHKIGMTRRLEPLDRVRELGDASVPFRFDVHALIYSDNAPQLENNLHKAFVMKRVNMINNRKEFYHVSLDDIEKVVKETNAEIEFVKLPEAREFRETHAILNKNEEKIDEKKKYIFPDSLIN